jgi:hypothetical protein
MLRWLLASEAHFRITPEFSSAIPKECRENTKTYTGKLLAVPGFSENSFFKFVLGYHRGRP